jgi:hypothetical protein
MAIPLNQGAQSRPSIKFPHINAGIELAVVGSRRVPWIEFGTDRPKLGDDGQPRQQLRLTGIVVSAGGVVTGPQGQERPVQVGEIVDYYAHGHAWGAFIEAERAMATAGLTPQVGDILLVVFTHLEPSSRAGAQDKRVKTTTLRRARPDEQAWVQQAEQAYYALGFDKPDVPAAPAQPGPFDGGQQAPYQQPQQPQYPAQQAPAYPPQQQPYQQPQQPQYAPQPQQQYPPQQQGPGF